jgi:hypothetical protein
MMDSSWAIHDPFISKLSQPPDEAVELSRRIGADSSSTSSGVCFGIDMVQRMLQRSGLAVCFDWLMPSQCVDVQLEVQRARHERAIHLLRLWRLNELGLDEETRSIVEKAIEEGFHDDLNPTLSTEAVEAVLARHHAKNEAAIRLLRKWMADESGYDEKAWPIAKKAIEENRLSYRKRFSD